MSDAPPTTNGSALVEIPNHLIHAILRKDVVLLVGSGVSAAARIPGVEALLRKVAAVVEGNEGAYDPRRWMEEMQAAITKASKHEVGRIIHDCIADALDRIGNSEAHAGLVRLAPHVQDLYTTNYDPLIERFVGPAHSKVIIRDQDLSEHSAQKLNVHKIHGDFNTMSEAVIGTDDYAKSFDDRKNLLENLKQSFTKKTVLIIGYSMADLNVLATYFAAAKNQPGRKHVMVLRTNADEAARDRARDLGCYPICLDAQKFLPQLAKKVEAAQQAHELARSQFDHKPALTPDFRNPFKVFSAEEMDDLALWKKHFFLEPKVNGAMEAAKEAGNRVFEGHRGCGKTTLLRYTSYRVQRALGLEPDYIGLYVKAKGRIWLNCRRRPDETNESWFDRCSAYLSTLVAESLLYELLQLLDEDTVSVADEAELVKRIQTAFWMPHAQESLKDLTHHSLGSRRHELSLDQAIRPPMPDALQRTIAALQDQIVEFNGKRIHVLLDEYEKMKPDHQRVFNNNLLDRSSDSQGQFCFKIGVKALEFDSRVQNPDGEGLSQLENPADYKHIQMDAVSRQDKAQFSAYTEFIEDIANRRLTEVFGSYGIKVRNLFPRDSGSRYSGFESLVKMSNFLPREFLSLAHDILDHNMLNVPFEKGDVLQPVPPRNQQLVVKVLGHALWNSLDHVRERGAQDRPITRRDRATRLANLVVDICERVPHLTSGSDPRTPTGFELNDMNLLSEDSRDALIACQEIRILLASAGTRTNRNRLKVDAASRLHPTEQFELNRLLCAYFGLPLGWRYPQLISSEVLNHLMASKDAASDALDQVLSSYPDYKPGIIEVRRRQHKSLGEFPEQALS